MMQVFFDSKKAFKENFHEKNKNILVLTSKGHQSRGSVVELINFFELSNFTIKNIEPNPTFSSINKLIDELSPNYYDMLISFGGGSVIDTTKALSIFLNNENLFKTYFNKEKINHVNKKNILQKIPHLAIPTTSGSGSEATSFASIWSFENKKKYSLENKVLLPEKVILDSNYLLSLNYKNTMFPGLDALSHCFDSFLNKNSTQESLDLAEKSVNSFCNYFLDLNQNLESEELRYHIHYASYLAGKAININKTSVTHALSYPLTLYLNIPHGLACGIFIAPITKLYYKELEKLKNSEPIFKTIELLNNIDLSNELKNYTKKINIDIYKNGISEDRLSNFRFKFNNNDLEFLIKEINLKL